MPELPHWETTPDDLPAAIREIKAALRARIEASGRSVREVFGVMEARVRARVEEIAADKARGATVWPVIDYGDIEAGTVTAEDRAALRRRGCLRPGTHLDPGNLDLWMTQAYQSAPSGTCSTAPSNSTTHGTPPTAPQARSTPARRRGRRRHVRRHRQPDIPCQRHLAPAAARGALRHPRRPGRRLGLVALRHDPQRRARDGPEGLGQRHVHPRGAVVRAAVLTDGPHGVRMARGGDMAHITDSAPATCFPTAAMLGSTWDVDLLREIGAALGGEARDHGPARQAGAPRRILSSGTRHPPAGWRRPFRTGLRTLPPTSTGQAPRDRCIHVGSSSRDLPLAQRIRLDVAVPVSPLNEDSTLEEWYAHHRGRQIAADLFGKAMGAEDGRLGETSIWEFVSQMPVATLLKVSPGDGGRAAVDLADLLHAANDGQEAGTAEW